MKVIKVQQLESVLDRKLTEFEIQLIEDNEILRQLFKDMQNVAAALTNFCEENGSTRKLEARYSNLVNEFLSMNY